MDRLVFKHHFNHLECFLWDTTVYLSGLLCTVTLRLEKGEIYYHSCLGTRACTVKANATLPDLRKAVWKRVRL